MILVCSICGASHYTQNCPEYVKGDHVKDKPSLNLSRSSVPNGLLIMDTPDGGSCVVTSQKFAKGTRFGPLLAQRSYVPVQDIPFPLVLFAAPYSYQGEDEEYSRELQTLFSSGRNIHLDTRNEAKCNWMIHVSLARFSNEQNLICYQENDEIYYTAVKDIELGDILRVWYSRSYAAKIGASLLEPSPYDICNNILRSVSMDYGFELDKTVTGRFGVEEFHGSSTGSLNSIGASNSAGSVSTVGSGPSCSGGGRIAGGSSSTTTCRLLSSSYDDHSGAHHSVDSGLADIDSNNNSGSFCSTNGVPFGASGGGGSCGGAVQCNGEVSNIASTSAYDKVSLPPIDSLMKTTSPKYHSNTPQHQQHLFDMDLLAGDVAHTGLSSMHHSVDGTELMDGYFSHSSFSHSSHQLVASQPLEQHQHVQQTHSVQQQEQQQQQQHQQLLSFQHELHQHNQQLLQQQPQQSQQHHVDLIAASHEDDLRFARQLSGQFEQHQPGSHQSLEQHHSQPQQQHQQMLDYHPTSACLPDDTLSPADLINISLGASDMNISFDSFGDNSGGQLLGYDAVSDDGPDGVSFCDSSFALLATPGTGSIGGGVGDMAGGLEKLHSRFSSSSDSLITLHDAAGCGLGLTADTSPASLAPPSTPGTLAPALPAEVADADKKYVCEVCLRKYMTKSNLDKHVRKHNLFLCVFCMKLFQQADEMKDHECSERRTKSAYLHCPKCLKVLSNSWSLQRHMKIHKELTQDGVGASLDELAVAVVKVEKDLPAFEDLSSATPPSEDLKPTTMSVPFERNMMLTMGHEIKQEMFDAEVSLMTDQQQLPEPVAIKSEPAGKTGASSSPPTSPQTPAVASALPSAGSSASTNTSSSQDMLTNVQAPNGKQLYKCIVCSKLFKNPNALEKHLRKVHTVYTVSNDHKSEKKVLSQINQKKTSPIKPAIAKALATKLSQKSKKQEELNAAAAAAAAAAASGTHVTDSKTTSDGTAALVNAHSVVQPPSIIQEHHIPKVACMEPASSQMSRQGTKKKTTSIGEGGEKSSNSGGLSIPGTANGRQHSIVGGGSRQGGANTKDQPNTASSSAAPTSAKSHSIIIISNLELTNNNLIDTSQLFHGGATGPGGTVGGNTLGNKIDVKVLNATDKLPKLVPISNHHHHQSTIVGMGGAALQLSAGGTLMVPPQSTPSASAINMTDSNVPSGLSQVDNVFSSTTAGDVDAGCSFLVEDISNAGGSVSSASTLPESQLGTVSSGKQTQGNESLNGEDDLSPPEGHDACATITVDLAQQTFPCDECDRVFAKNYQLKRHMEIHDSVYYTCPYCDRGPLKAKASLRKHLYNVHPERAPPKEQINKFISTLVVTDETVLRELAIKNEQKIRNKCAKVQAKQVQQQQLQQQQQQQQRLQHHVQKQRQQESRRNLESVSHSSPVTLVPNGTGTPGGGVVMYENGFPGSVLSEEGEDMLSFKAIFPTEGSIGESSIDQMDHGSLENCDQSSTCSSSTNHISLSGPSSMASHEEDKKRKSSHSAEQQRPNRSQQHPVGGGGNGRGHSLAEGGQLVGEGKRMKMMSCPSPVSGHRSTYFAGTSSGPMNDGTSVSRESGYGRCSNGGANVAGAPTNSAVNGTGGLRYLRKNQSQATGASSLEVVSAGGSSSGSHIAVPHGHNSQPQGSLVDGSGAPQLNLDSLFGNISIDNYEFDDNTTIQSFSLIEEKFKTSFDQIQEKLDAELPFDEEQIKWQNNLMANDSSSEIGDKMLNGEENMMLI